VSETWTVHSDQFAIVTMALRNRDIWAPDHLENPRNKHSTRLKGGFFVTHLSSAKEKTGFAAQRRL